MPVSVLVVGGGSIGERHLRCFQQVGSEVALCEANDIRRGEVAVRYGLARTFADLSEATRESWDAAVICTPAHLHVQHALQLASCTAAYLIEKPLCTEFADAARLSSGLAGKVVQIAYVLRAHPATQHVRDQLASGEIGMLRQITVVAGQHFPTFRPAYREIYYARRESGGGAIQDAATHLFDLIQCLAGPLDWIFCDATHQELPGVEVEDTVHLLGRAAGVQVSLALNQFMAPNETHVQLNGSRGSLAIRFHEQRAGILCHGDKQWSWTEPLVAERDDLFRSQAEHFLAAAAGRQPPLCSLVDGLAALRVNLAALESAESHAPVVIPTEPTELPPPAAGRSQALYREARQLIPGGTQLLSKRPEMFAPDQWPAYYAEARGCEVVDLDGRRYLDFTHNGVGACLLGYAHPRVTAAVALRVQRGSMCSLNSPDEVALARELIDLHPWAEQARFARCGGEALAIAARIVRAATGRDIIALCGYHGWADWYLAANLDANRALDGHLLPGLSPAGVPRALAGTALPFAYNRLDELEAIVRMHGQRLAAVIMEPTRNMPPAAGFLAGVRALCDESGAKLVFDEVTTGFRLRLGGVHLDYGVEPDVAVFAKALGNGHPIAAVIGRAGTMEAAQSTFISSTYWTEGVGPAAALATIQVMREVDVPAHVRKIGEQFRSECQRLAEKHSLPLALDGYPALTTLGFAHPDSAALVTLFTVRMLNQGFLAGGGFYPTLAHQAQHVEAFAQSADSVFAELAESLRLGDTRARIGGPLKHAGFARLT